MSIYFQFIISLFAIIPLFIPLQIEYIDALDFDNDSLEEGISPYINTIKNENYKKQKINFANTIETSSELETTKNNNISDKSIIKQEKNTLNENFTIYDEGLGIKLEYLYPLIILAKSDKSTCYDIDLCFLHLGILNRTDTPQIWIIRDSFESQTINEQCQCNILEDYVIYINKKMISQFDNFSFIIENRPTFIGDNSAIQLEYEFSLADTKINTITVATKDNDSFYQFTYYANSESFSNYLSHFKEIINTIEFVPQKES
jgi:hypothetical protein